MNKGGEVKEALKEQMIHYWTERAPKFSDLRVREFYSNKKQIWSDELYRHLPAARKLNILDIGTGTGFFCFLLGEMGHCVTGIDLTEEMIIEAKKISKHLGIEAEFFVMDGENPEFEDHSFDVIVSRNLTWALPHLDEAYRNWHRILKPHGIFLNFDADYCHEKQKLLPENHSHKDISRQLMQEYEQMKGILRSGQKLRPAWDRELLQAAGFRNIEMDLQVWQRIYAEYDEFYNPAPVFSIKARA